MSGDEDLARRLVERRLLSTAAARAALQDVARTRAAGRHMDLASWLSARGLVDPAALRALQGGGPAHDPPRPPTARSRGLLPTAPARIDAGTVVHGYTVERELGRGGMGAVFLARDRAGAPVALKVILGLAGDARRLERFRREVGVVRSLDHPGIVRVLGAEVEGELPCMVQEYVPGTTLAEVLGDPAAALATKLDLLEQVCRAVAHAHQRGIVHRDLKPENVFVTAEGQAKVGDFGVARDLTRETRVTATGAMVGSPRYMAPEQIRGAEVSARSDVFALGVLLYQALTQRLPFDAKTPMALCALVLQGNPERPSRAAELPDALSSAADRVVLRALATAADDRHPDALALADDVKDLRAALGAATRGARLQPTRRGWLALVGVAGGFALLALLGAFAWSRASGDGEPQGALAAAQGDEPAGAADASVDPQGPRAAGRSPRAAGPGPVADASGAGDLIRLKLERGDLAGARALLEDEGGRAGGRAGEGAVGPARRAQLLVALEREEQEQDHELRRADALCQDFAAHEALTLLRGALSRRPAAGRLLLGIAHAEAEHGHYHQALAHAADALQLDPALAPRWEATRAAVEAGAASLPARAGPPPALPSGWAPFQGGRWELDRDELHATARGLGPFEHAGLIRQGAPWTTRYVLAVELQLGSGRAGAYAGLLFGARSANELFTAYVFHDEAAAAKSLGAEALAAYRREHGAWPKYVRVAHVSGGRWQALGTYPVAFADGAWARLRLTVNGRQLVIEVDGQRAAQIALPRTAEGRLGLSKYYGTEVRFRGFEVDPR